LRTLFDITKALVSKVGHESLSAISGRLSKLIRHAHALLTLRNDAGLLDMYAPR